MTKLQSFLLPILLVVALVSAQEQDSEKTEDKKKKVKIKPYAEVITKEAVTDSGLIIIHQMDDSHPCRRFEQGPAW